MLVAAFFAALCVAAACARAGEAPMPVGADANDPVLMSGRAIWINRCARCHAPNGSGGAGPRLAGKVTNAYPDASAEIAVVRNGKGSGMPAWKSVLSEADIAAVVDYTRRVL
ncbi:unannotated protein [freshwater metagenome]|uniref:Unannotated protein n=1 Tax=freshwater metagenome TaxID=449393 RepID=A0A6J6TL30_9ZZZZ